MKNGNYSIEDKNKIGVAIADIFYLKKDTAKGRYKTSWGNKTAIGIFETVLRLGQEIKDGSIEASLKI